MTDFPPLKVDTCNLVIAVRSESLLCTLKSQMLCLLGCRCLLSSSSGKAEAAVTLWNRKKKAWLCTSTTAEQIAGELRRGTNRHKFYTDTRQQASRPPPDILHIGFTSLTLLCGPVL